MTRPTTTLVLVTRSHVVRADHARGARLALVRRERPVQGDLADVVESALAGARPGKRVWVLSADLWLQTQPLPPGAANLPPDEVAAALRFEAEALSGLPAIGSVVGFAPAGDGPGGPEVLLVQGTQAEQAKLAARVGRLGPRLEGVVHPAALPAPLGVAHPERGWTRTELWPEAVVLVVGTPAGLRTQVINESPLRGAWEREAEAWFERVQAPPSRSLLVADEASPRLAVSADSDDGAARLVDLEDEAALGGWLDAWAAVLTVARPPVPRLAPPPRPASPLRQVALAVGLGLAAATLCFAHHRAVSSRRQALARERERLESPANELRRLREQVAVAERRLRELEVERLAAEAQLRDHREGVTLQRRRHLALLEALARHHDPALMIERIDEAQGKAELHGLCVDGAAANTLAVNLQRDLAARGWQVQPAELHVAPGGCQFKIPLVSTARLLSPVTPGTTAAPASAPGRGGGS